MTRAANSRRVGTNLTEGPILQTLLKFAVPIILAIDPFQLAQLGTRIDEEEEDYDEEG